MDTERWKQLTYTLNTHPSLSAASRFLRSLLLEPLLCSGGAQAEQQWVVVAEDGSGGGGH